METKQQNGIELNLRMNATYDAVNNAYEHICNFYLENVVFNSNCNDAVKQQFKDLFNKMGAVKEIAHELAEHYTWD